jgi:hypothetical protein
MAERREKTVKATAPADKRDQQEYWRLVEKAGGYGEALHQWIVRGMKRAPPEDFDDGILPSLISMEQQFWGPERAARRAAKGVKHGLLPPTREEYIQNLVGELISLKAECLRGQKQEAVVRRLVRKIRAAVDKPRDKIHRRAR